MNHFLFWFDSALLGALSFRKVTKLCTHIEVQLKGFWGLEAKGVPEGGVGEIEFMTFALNPQWKTWHRSFVSFLTVSGSLSVERESIHAARSAFVFVTNSFIHSFAQAVSQSLNGVRCFCIVIHFIFICCLIALPADIGNATGRTRTRTHKSPSAISLANCGLNSLCNPGFDFRKVLCGLHNNV